MRVVLSGRRVATALLALAVAGSAAAAATSTTSPRPAQGRAASDLRLLNLSVGGRALSIGHLALSSNVEDGASTNTPLTSGSSSFGRRSVSSGSLIAPSITSDDVLPTALSRLLTVTTPGASMTAGPGFARAGVDSLGSVSILGLPLSLDGTAQTTTTVNGAGARAEKTLVVRNLALPSIAGLLGALGLDITKLPSTTLSSLVQRLGLVNSTISDARAALDAALGPLQPQLTAAQQQVDAAQAAAAAAKAELAADTSDVTAATATLHSATQALQAALDHSAAHLVRGKLLGLPTAVPTPLLVVPTIAPTLLPTPLPSVSLSPTPLPTAVPTVLPTALPTALPTVLPTALPTAPPSLPAIVPADVQGALDVYNAAAAAYADAVTQLNHTTGALNLANGVLNTAGATVNALLVTVQTQVDGLVHALIDVLAATPLVRVDSFTVRTEAAATSAANGGQSAKVVSGEIQGVHVLGNDVLSQTLHRDRVDLGAVSNAAMDVLTARIGDLTGALSSELSNVPGLPTLSVPAPQIQLLSQTASTGVTDGFGTARTVVTALRITLPPLTIPPAVQLPSAIGALSLKAVGDVLTKPLVLGVGAMQDTASFRPAVLAANNSVVPPGSGSPGTAAGPSASHPTGTT
ncbi:MAG: hypothetical protein JWO88_3, partial [Frankiales bacterium]|nr:hypothetical protein [Frankiales bacterium]